MKFIYYIKIFYIIFSRTKFIFSKPKKVDILLYDQGHKFNKIISNYFKKYKKTILFSRFEELNICIILDILINFKFLNRHSLFQNYVIEYCRLTKPKLIISSNLLDIKLLSLKKKIDSEIKIILIQRCPLNNKYFKNLKHKYKVDYIFHMDNVSLQVLKRYFISQYVKIGSLANNQFKIKKKESKNILLISGYRKIFSVENPITEWELNVKQEKTIIEMMSKNIIKGVKFNILLKPFVILEDYCKIMKAKKSILIQNKNINPYNIMDKHNLVITLNNGTMGHEALARGIKHVRVCRNNLFVSDNFFETRSIINIKKFLINFYNMPTKKFFEICHKKKIDLFPHDYDNLILRNIIIRIVEAK